MSTEMPVIQHPESIKNRGTGKSRVEDPKKNLDSKTHGRSILLMMVMGLEVFFFSPIGPRATFLGLWDYLSPVIFYRKTAKIDKFENGTSYAFLSQNRQNW